MPQTQHRVHQRKCGFKQKRHTNGKTFVLPMMSKINSISRTLVQRLNGGRTQEEEQLPLGDILSNAERILEEVNSYNVITPKGKIDTTLRAEYLRIVREELKPALPDAFEIRKVGKGEESRLVLIEDNEIIYDSGIRGTGRKTPDYSRYETSPLSLQRAD